MVVFLPTMFATLLICPTEDLPDQIHMNPFVLTPVDKEAVRGCEGNLTTIQLQWHHWRWKQKQGIQFGLFFFFVYFIS